MAKRALSRPQLLLELRKILVRPTTILRKRNLKKQHATALWKGIDPETEQVINLVIVVDPRLLGLVQAVLHELIHVYGEEQTAFFRSLSEDLEETMVVALAKDLSTYLESPKRIKLLDSWTKSIERKLA